MRQIVRRLWLGLALIVMISATLLLSDWRQRQAGAHELRRVALFKFNSRPILDEGAEGVIEGLRRKGFVPGKNIQLQQFNAENDLPTANSISRSLSDGSFDLVITLSTPCLQTMAAANTAGKVMHVFGLVTDPFASGVGLDRSNPLGHPRHMIGIGTFQPVRDVFLLARKANPQLRRVGSVWNPAEACSEACMRIARATTRELGIELVEANVENSTGVYEAANSLVARGVEALFVGGDNTVDVAIKSVVKAADQGRIPVFTCTPANIDSGVRLGLGADYYEVGRTIGELAGDVLSGYDPAKYAIADVLPKKLALNLAVMPQGPSSWRVTDEMRASAAFGIDEKGNRWTKTTRALAKKWNIHLVELVNAPAIDETREGILKGLREAGMVEGRDYEVKIANAQGDLPTLTSLIDAALTDHADMIYTITTPALQAAMRKVKDRPLLFALSLDPLLIGDSGTHERHRSNVAGVYDRSPFEEMLKLVRQCLPQAHSLGTLFAPAESNSVQFHNELDSAARAAGFRLVAVASNSAGEVADAALALTGRGIDAICQINDNLHGSAFPSIVTAAARARLPIFSFSSGQAAQGASLVLSNDHVDGGRESALVAAAVMRGASPAEFSYRGITRTRLLVNPEAAAAVKLRIPEELLRRAERVKR